MRFDQRDKEKKVKAYKKRYDDRRRLLNLLLVSVVAEALRGSSGQRVKALHVYVYTYTLTTVPI